MVLTLTLTADEIAAADTIPLLDGETREQAIARMLHHEALRPIVERYQRERRESAALQLQTMWNALTPDNKIEIERIARAKIAAQTPNAEKSDVAP